MSYSINDIQYETRDFFVKSDPNGYGVYRQGITHATRVAIFGTFSPAYYDRAIADCMRRQEELDAQAGLKKAC